MKTPPGSGSRRLKTPVGVGTCERLLRAGFAFVFKLLEEETAIPHPQATASSWHVEPLGFF
jgi:hypothetical protein